jgi:shikimate kinase
MNDNIVLIGFMGAGKSTLGRWMSENVNLRYIDTDDYIEEWQGMSINDIFAGRGEEYFRSLETECLERLRDSTHLTVVSVGGGMPMRDENRRIMRELGAVVYLRATEDELVKRLHGDDKRPMLKGDDLRTRIRQLMAQREETYLEAADIVLDTGGKSLNQLYNEIEDFMSSWKNGNGGQDEDFGD